MIDRTKLKEKMNDDFDTICEIADETRGEMDDMLIRYSLKLKSRYFMGMEPDEYIALISEVFNDLRVNSNLIYLEGLTASLEAINTKIISVETRTDLTGKEGK